MILRRIGFNKRNESETCDDIVSELRQIILKHINSSPKDFNLRN